MYYLALELEYDGSFFSGWQIQPNAITVQEELEKTISMVCRTENLKLRSSGRTDKGVHALSHWIGLDIEGKFDLHRHCVSINSILKGRVMIKRALRLVSSFHPLRLSKGKIYEYHIWNHPGPLALNYGRALHVPYKLNLELLRQDMTCLVGQHDFSSFRASGCAANSPIKTINSAEVLVRDDRIYGAYLGKIELVFSGSGFLKQMIRIIVGTLLKRNRAQIIMTIPEILQRRDRHFAGRTAPPHGLHMRKCEYDQEDMPQLLEQWP